MFYQLECINKMVRSVLKKVTTFHCILGNCMISLNITLPKYQLTLLGLFYIAGNWWQRASAAGKHPTMHNTSPRTKNCLTQMSIVFWLIKQGFYKIMLKMLPVPFIYKSTDILGNMAFWLWTKLICIKSPLGILRRNVIQKETNKKTHQLNLYKENSKSS